MPVSAGTTRWRGLAPLAASSALALGVEALRCCFTADEQHSWFLGHVFGAACAFRVHFGIPCPNCGMTRSLILAAHGEFTRAASVAPGGAAMVLASALASALLALLGVTMLSGRTEAIRRTQTATRVGVLTAAAATAGIWFAGWAWQVVHALRHG